MGVKWKVKLDKIPRMEAAAKELNGHRIEVGAHGEHAWLAGIHEFGCTIPVTPKMRAFLHHKGVHLKKSTTQIVIPERSFLRGGMENSQGRLNRELAVLLKAVLGGDMPADTMLEKLGGDLASWIKTYAKSGAFEPNSDLTVNGSEDDWGLEGLPGKGTANPLVGTGGMIGGIGHEVK